MKQLSGSPLIGPRHDVDKSEDNFSEDKWCVRGKLINPESNIF